MKWSRPGTNYISSYIPWWWNERKHDWLYQKALFCNGCDADGLELWVVYVALGVHLTVVKADSIWSSHPSCFNYSDTVLMCTHEGVVFCDWEPQEYDKDPDTSGSMVGAPMDFPEEEEMPSGSVSCPRTVRDHISLPAKLPLQGRKMTFQLWKM